MDPLTALSFAGTVVQFVDFSTKILKASHEIYQSVDGTPRDHDELELVLSDLFSLTQKLKVPPRYPMTSPSNVDDQKMLDELCHACLVVADELQKGLDKLKASSKIKIPGMGRRWNSLQQGIRIIWTNADRLKLIERLATLKESLRMTILVGLRYAVEFH